MTNEEIKQWLKLNKRNQKWAGEQLEVHEKTVNRWLNGALEMPAYLRENFEMLMLSAIRKEMTQLRDFEFSQKVEAAKEEAEAKINAVSISDGALYRAASAIGMTPQELLQAVLIRTAVKISKDITLDM